MAISENVVCRTNRVQQMQIPNTPFFKDKRKTSIFFKFIITYKVEGMDAYISCNPVNMTFFKESSSSLKLSFLMATIF